MEMVTLIDVFSFNRDERQKKQLSINAVVFDYRSRFGFMFNQLC